MWSWHSTDSDPFMFDSCEGIIAGSGIDEAWEFPTLADETTVAEPPVVPHTRRIPEDEWQVHKEEMRALFLIENKSREEVMAVMEKTHGFRATKAQYIRKFNRWGFKKNSTDEQWKFIAQKVGKRHLEGKESDIYINGKLMPQKKVKKEASRHSLPSWQIMSIAGRSPPPLDGVEIRTPPREYEPFVKYLRIPWFEFETLVEPWIQRYLQLSRDHTTTPSLPVDQSARRAHHILTRVPSSGTSIATGQWHNYTKMLRAQVGAVQELENDRQAQKSNPSIQVREKASDSLSGLQDGQKARSIFAIILGVDRNRRDCPSILISRLDNILIERQDGDIKKSLQRFLDSSILEMTLQLLRYSIYLSSNNLLSNSKTDKLLRWIIRSDQFAAIEHLIRLKTATTEIFGSNILLSAIRIDSEITVRALISAGVDVNIPGGSYPKKSALLQATEKITMSRHLKISHKNRIFSLLRLLLDAGADINTKSGHENTFPLQEVMSEMNVELVQMFLLHGTTLEAPTNGWAFIDTDIIQAARHSDYTWIRRLVEERVCLKPLKKASMITVLQDAVVAGDVDTVQSLLNSGIDVDAPAGVGYEAARKAAVQSNNMRHLQSAIQIAASKGKTEIVQVLLEAGANVDGYLFTPEEYSFYESTSDQYAELVEYHEDYRYAGSDYSDEDAEEDDGTHCSHFHWTPLQSAVARKDILLVRWLLLAGADVEGRGLGLTPLQLAVLKNDVRLVKLMLKNCAAVNAPARGVRGRTALQAAVEKGDTYLIEMLIDAGADLNAAAGPNSGLTTLQAAAQVNNVKLVVRLISLGVDVNAAASPINGRTCLQAAAEQGNLQLVQILLNSGAEVNAAGAASCGMTALQAAVKGNNLPVAKMLLAAGANVNAPSAEGSYSAVSAAVENGSLEMLQLILQTADPNGQADQVPPLLRASSYGITEKVQYLINAGANINAPRIGWTSGLFGHARTALEAALERGHADIFHLLLNVSTSGGGQVPDLGAALGATIWRPEYINMDIVRKLLNAGADVNRAFRNRTPLHRAVFHGNLDLIQIFLEAGADVNARTPEGETALHFAVRSGDTVIAQALLNVGAEINVPAATDTGRTALQEAAKSGNTSLVRFLLEQGADCNAPAADLRGKTALQAAAIGGHLHVALILLKAGANINAPAAKTDGRTALEAAAEHGRLDIVSLLLENDTDLSELTERCEAAAKRAEETGHIVISKMLRNYKKD